jgi:hypothetical protein
MHWLTIVLRAAPAREMASHMKHHVMAITDLKVRCCVCSNKQQQQQQQQQQLLLLPPQHMWQTAEAMQCRLSSAAGSDVYSNKFFSFEACGFNPWHCMRPAAGCCEHRQRLADSKPRAALIVGCHAACLCCVQVMIDDSHLLAASEDRTWTIWDMNTEKLSKIYRAAMGAVRGVAMGPDQVSLAANRQRVA